MDFKRGDIVSVRDYPFGRPLNVRGKVVGILKNDNYNVLIEEGINEGKIIKYKYWKLYLLDREEEIEEDNRSLRKRQTCSTKNNFI